MLKKATIGNLDLTGIEVEEQNDTGIGTGLLSLFARVVLDFRNKQICFEQE